MSATVDEGRTHWETCWKSAGHHDCAIRYVQRMLEKSGLDTAEEVIEVLPVKIKRPFVCPNCWEINRRELRVVKICNGRLGCDRCSHEWVVKIGKDW
ncbi:MAG: hypothetical protein ACXABY_01305 [Candidatus Thorarchaeota archaeon]|jgi:hypothetical protein